MTSVNQMLTLLKRCGDLYDQPFTLVAVERDDQSLVFVNQAFRDITQYEDHEILGSNCRFLQGKQTNKLTTMRIRKAISNKMPVCEDLLNYRKDGSQFWNRLLLLPIAVNGECFFFGMQHVISESKLKEVSNSAKMNSEKASEWIKSRLNVIFLTLQLLEMEEKPELLETLNRHLKSISKYVLQLDIT